MTKDRTFFNNLGQRDRSEGNGYNQPYGFADKMLTFGKNNDRVHDSNKAYAEGWRNADKQAR